VRLSVIIPTHNRAGSLARSLRSVVALDDQTHSFEVVVVDNARSEETAQVVQEIQGKGGGPAVRYVREDRLGAHNARHAGARVATGELLLFSDDDITFSPRWVNAYIEAFSAHAGMAAAGGPIRAAWDAAPPDWLIDFMERKESFVGGDWGFGPLGLLDRSEELLIEQRGFFFSANMAIRRRVLFELGGFNPDLAGRTLLGDGETGLVYKLWKRELLIGYVPEAAVLHHIRPEQMTVGYLRERYANQGACETYSAFHPNLPGRKVLGRHAVSSARQAARAGVKAARVWNKTAPADLRAQMYAAYEARCFLYTLRLIVDARRRALVERDDWIN